MRRNKQDKDLLGMLIHKAISFLHLFLVGLFIITHPHPSSASQQYYREKKVFYDSLSIVLNKYIVPVGNWSLFNGTLEGIRKRVGDERFKIRAAGSLVEVSIGKHPPRRFSRERIDTNAIEMVDGLSGVLDESFEEFAETGTTEILNCAIAGMVATLEPNSYFIAPADLKRIQDQNMGVFGGIGLEITVRDGFITVVSPYEDTPAFRQGLKPNDRIIAIDGLDAGDSGILEVAEKIRGEEGQPVTLTIARQGWEKPREISLERASITHRTVRSLLLEPGFGYIRVSHFLGTTADDFAAALNGLTTESQLNGLIIDLRFNPGGLLSQALVLADFFLGSGVIATAEGRVKSDNKTFYARPATLPNDYPIVVIINGGSASGSEIIASALRDRQRAVLVGEKSFGKGYIQAIFPINTGGAIRLTTAKLLTPGGREIQGIGIKPDLDLPAEILNRETPGSGERTDLPALDSASSMDDPTVRISLDILKRSFLLMEISHDEAANLPEEQVPIIKRFNGLLKAISEVGRQM